MFLLCTLLAIVWRWDMMGRSVGRFLVMHHVMEWILSAYGVGHVAFDFID